jgi:hypothetical protein
MWDNIQELIKAMAEDEFISEALLNSMGHTESMPMQINPLTLGASSSGRITKQNDGSFQREVPNYNLLKQLYGFGISPPSKDEWIYKDGRWLVDPNYKMFKTKNTLPEDPPRYKKLPKSTTDAVIKKEKTKEDAYDKSMFRNLFLISALDAMQGKSPQPAPVVTGGPTREFPSMARMMTPMEQQKPYWWVSRSV